MSNTSPTRRTALNLPSRRKHAIWAAIVLLSGLILPIVAIAVFGNPTDASAEGRYAVAPRPTIAPLSPLDDETLRSPDLLAGDIPEGVNPTEAMTSGAAEAVPLETPAETTPTPKIINVIAQPSIALPKAPITGLTRQSVFGPVPVKGTNNALLAYRRPVAMKSGKQPVSLIIGGLGINGRGTEDVIQRLPADVTLSFAVHTRGLQNWIDKARADGHEVLIEIPMESAEFDPSEPNAQRTLRVTASPQETGRNVDWAMSRAQGYAGIINFNGDQFLTRTDIAGPFVDYLSKTGLGFITDGDFETPSLPSIAKAMEQPFKAGHGLIDPDPIPQVISSRLVGLTNAAKSGEHPIGVGFGYTQTLAEVERWIASLDAHNLQLVPATAALK